jgi:hypothetical protein
VIVAGYLYYNKYKASQKEQLAQKYALITAQSWLATARFKDEPEEYLVFRDSLLKSHNVSTADIESFFSEHEEKSEKYVGFAGLVKFYIDSLVLIEDSILKAASDTVKDASIPDN